MLTVLIVTSIGAVLSKMGKIPADGRKMLGYLLYTIFLPALVFVSVATSIELESLAFLWILPLTFMIYLVVGVILGYLVIFLLRPPKYYRSAIVIAVSVNSAGYIPLVIIHQILVTSTVIDPNSADLVSMAEGFIGLYIALLHILFWSVGKWYLTFDVQVMHGTKELYSTLVSDDDNDALESVVVDAVGTATVSELAAIEVGEAEEEEEEGSLPALMDGSASSSSHSLNRSNDGSDEELKKEKENENVEEIENEQRAAGLMGDAAPLLRVSSYLQEASRRLLPHVQLVFNPPAIAVICGLACVVVPPIRAMLFDSSSGVVTLVAIGQSLRLLDQPTLACALLLLGASMISRLQSVPDAASALETAGSNWTPLPRRVLGGIIVARLIIMPLVGMLYVYALSVSGLWQWILHQAHWEVGSGSARLLAFILLLEAATPTNSNMIVQGQVLGHNTAEISFWLFVIYCCSLVSLAFFIPVFLYALDFI